MSTQPRFVHLRTHTDFSMIDGIVKGGNHWSKRVLQTIWLRWH